MTTTTLLIAARRVLPGDRVVHPFTSASPIRDVEPDPFHASVVWLRDDVEFHDLAIGDLVTVERPVKGR